MQVAIEFYRTRDTDDAYAVVGREMAEAADLDDAMEVVRLLSQTLDMPQRPDAMTITDATGAALYSGAIDRQGNQQRDAMIIKARDNDTEQMRNVLAIGIWENEGGASGRSSLDEQCGRDSEAGLTQSTACRPSTSIRTDAKDRSNLIPRARLARSATEDCLS
ncbi:MAG: hypothetical protein RLO21_04195 [Nitratireductor sp.]